MSKRQKKYKYEAVRWDIKRILVAVMALVLILSMVIAMIVQYAAYAESGLEDDSTCDSYELEVILNESDQALYVRQRLIYYNDSPDHLDRVVFYAMPNMFRRESALMYGSDALEACFPSGYAPGGLVINSVSVDGESADWSAQGSDECYLRIACDLDSGESCTFEFDYSVYLTANRAFLGAYELDWRLSMFYLAALCYDPDYGEFVTTQPLEFTRFLFTERANYTINLTLPSDMYVSSTGNAVMHDNNDGTATWNIEAVDTHEIAISAGRRWHYYSEQTDVGVEVHMFASNRAGAKDAISLASEVLDIYNGWFGSSPFSSINICESDIGVDYMVFPGMIWMSSELFNDYDALAHAIYFGIAQQYFGITAYSEPVNDSWLSDAVCEYLTYLVVEETDGHNAFLRLLNGDVRLALQITVPGNLFLTSPASNFTAEDYKTVVLDRGSAVLHELRTAMGRDEFLNGLRLFYENGKSKDLVTEMDLVDAMNASDGGDWYTFLTEWAFNIDEYANETIYWYD